MTTKVTPCRAFKQRWQVAAVAAMVSLLTAGCFSAYDASVSGTVTYDGAPLKLGTVTFHPTSGAAAYGKIQSDGTFRLKTGEEVGIAKGEYKVTVAAVELIPSKSPDYPPGAKSLIPDKFRAPSQSGLAFTVERGRNHFDIALPKN